MAPPFLGILGSNKPPAATAQAVYTVPASRRCVVSSLISAEVAGLEASIRVYAVPSAGAPGVGNTMAYDVYMPASYHYGFTEGITLAAGEALYVESDTGNVTFTAFGEETDVPA